MFLGLWYQLPAPFYGLTYLIGDQGNIILSDALTSWWLGGGGVTPGTYPPYPIFLGPALLAKSQPFGEPFIFHAIFITTYPSLAGYLPLG